MRLIPRTSGTAVVFIICLSVFLLSCVKSANDAAEEQCNKLAAVKAKPLSAVVKGGTIRLSADSLAGAYYTWTGPNSFSSNNQNNDIDYAYFWHKGWYYLKVDFGNCQTRVDSVYADVKFPQGTAPCSLTNNFASFTSVPDQSYYYTGLTTSGGEYTLEGNSSTGDISVIFGAYWLTHEPEDGVYVTTSNRSNDYSKIDEIFISAVNSSIYFVAEPNKNVYVTHVGGKLQVSFCGIRFSGSNGGPLYTVTVDAKIKDN